MPTFQNESSPLERYGRNLTILAQQGAFPPLAAQEAAVNKVFQILLRENKCNPLILDMDGTSRWEIVAEVIRRMAVSDAPDHLPEKQVIALDYEALFANLSDDILIRQERRKQRLAPLSEKLAQVEPDSEKDWTLLEELFRWPELEEWIAPTMVLERLQSIFITMHRAASSSLLFVEHFHRLMGGEMARYPIDAPTLLKPTLARHQIQLIGACTLTQYRQYIERDAAISRRFQEVLMPDAQEECQRLRMGPSPGGRIEP